MGSKRNDFPSLPKRRIFSSARHHLSFRVSKSSASSASTTGDGTGMPNSSRVFGVAESARALAAEAADQAQARFHESMPASLRAQASGRYCVPAFKWDECVLGPLLGSGKFSDVFELRSLPLADDDEFGAEGVEQRLRAKKREKYHRRKNARYALKMIKLDHLETHLGRMEFVQAAGDLALEKEFLASLAHPHIIKLRGIAHSGSTGFALILDRLVETLDQRMRRWRTPTKNRRANISNLTSSFASMVKTPRNSIASMVKSPSVENLASPSTTTMEPESKAEGRDLVRSRLSIALQIASALKYLHSHSVIFRDLKPTNIGFDARDDVKLFDFGLARFCAKDRGDTFKMSVAGSPRYMAPECLSGKAYNAKADVYSFAIILWEILAGKTPYLFARRKDHLVDFVVGQNGRPDIDPHWPAAVKRTLERSFDVNIVNRPEMEQVYRDIRESATFMSFDRRLPGPYS